MLKAKEKSRCSLGFLNKIINDVFGSAKDGIFKSTEHFILYMFLSFNFLPKNGVT